MRSAILLLFLSVAHLSIGQKTLMDDMKETEEKLNASTKQINQFFLRFNGEEDIKGNRYNPADKQYRSESLRKKYLPVLFDGNSNMDQKTIQKFLLEVVDSKNPKFLDFYKNDWFCEVATTFTYNGKTTSGKLYMRLQHQGLGYAWIIDDVSFDVLKKNLQKDSLNNDMFIHPMSHELDFMTLRKALQPDKNASQYTSKKFKPDYLTVFIHEVNSGNLKFTSVTNVNIHFFAFDGWYFRIANVNRPGYNTGWLISDLVNLQNSDHKEKLKAYIYDKN
jgi:hypothetical protein